MADLFAPKLRGEPSYESPIQAPQEAPTYLEGIAKLGEFAFDAFTAYEKAEAKRQKATTSGIDPNLAVFAQDVQTIEKIRQEQGQQAANLFERQIAKKYAAVGIEFDTDYENVYEKITGRSFDGYGRDMQAYMMEETFKTKEFQQNYRASFFDLPPDATEEQRTQYAIGTQAEIDSAALTVARFNAGEQKKWTLQGQAAYDTVIGGFLKQGLGELNRREKSGQPIGPQDIANFQAQWAQAKVSLSKPSGVTNEQWSATQDKIDNIDKMISTFEKATSNKVALEQLTAGLVNLVDQQGDGTDFEKAVLKIVLFQDTSSLADLNLNFINEALVNISKADLGSFNITRQQIFSPMSEQSEAGVPSGNTIVQEYPEEITSKFSGMTEQQMLNNLKAGKTLTTMITPNSLSRPEARDQFESASYAIGLLLSQGGSNDFLSSGFLEELVGNRGFIENVKRFTELDPEGAVAIRSTLLTGLATESLRQSKNLASIERSIKGAKWDGSKYIVDLEGIEGVDGSIKQAFLDALDRRYDGSLEKAADDGFRRMRSVMAARSSFMRMGGEQDILYAGGFYDLDEAIDRRKAIRVLENASVGLQEAREGDEIGGLIQESFTEELPEQTSDTPVELDEPAIRGGLRGSDTPGFGEAGAAVRTDIEVDRQFNVVPQSRDQLSQERRRSLPGQRIVSLDFNGFTKKARGVEIVIPDDATPEERQAAQNYVDRVAQFFRENGLEDYPVRGVRTTSENKRGMSGYFHTEPFFNSDPEAVEIITNNTTDYAKILAETLGNIPGVTFIPPHTASSPGAVLPNGTSERDFGFSIIEDLGNMK
jgi:hypothetical protein